MNITLNHNPEVIETDYDSITVQELLLMRSFTYKMLIVKVNDALVVKENYSTATVKNGDNVMVIHLMTGG
ncbi:MAG: thiamine biosynthesis protein ThiS [Bacteroidales bacterium]|nr:MAG: thiamine biosynthesis protein ThiS [Bacteroidales bacterium]